MMHSSYQAIIFDLGGVILQQAYMLPAAVRVFAPSDEGAFRELLWQQLRPACLGERDLFLCWQGVARSMKRSIPEETLRRLWVDDYAHNVRLDQDVLAIVRKLRGHHRLGVISDTIEEHARVIRAMGIFEHFDDVILSHEVGMTKEMAAVFRLALQRLETSPHRSVFIDDVPQNVAIARRVGMEGIRFVSAIQLRQRLSEFGVIE